VWVRDQGKKVQVLVEVPGVNGPNARGITEAADPLPRNLPVFGLFMPRTPASTGTLTVCRSAETSLYNSNTLIALGCTAFPCITQSLFVRKIDTMPENSIVGVITALHDTTTIS